MTYRPTGRGFVPGVPRRELSAEEARQYGVEHSSLYERVAPPKPAPPAKATKNPSAKGTQEATEAAATDVAVERAEDATRRSGAIEQGGEA